MPRLGSAASLLWVGLSLSTIPASAQLADAVTLNGYGGWAAGDTDGNEYLAGADDREYDSADFALVVTAEVSDRLTVATQWDASIENEETEIDLDYAFAEWTFSDALRLRGGIVKQPFGIYNEIFDVGTARPFFDLPQGVYGFTEFLAEAYRGLGITGHVLLGDDWDLGYDLYGGEIVLDSTEFNNPLLFDPADGGEELEAEETIKDTVGARLTFSHTSGWSFGVSAYFGTPEEEEGPEIDDGFESSTHEVIGVYLQYISGPWELRAEAVRREGGDEDVEADTQYVEIARRLGEKWQLAARYDHADYVLEGDDVPESAQDHEDVAVSINYWLSSHLVFKLSLHDVQGNLYAVPSPTGDGDFETSTHLTQLGLQFSF